MYTRVFVHMTILLGVYLDVCWIASAIYIGRLELHVTKQACVNFYLMTSYTYTFSNRYKCSSKQVSIYISSLITNSTWWQQHRQIWHLFLVPTDVLSLCRNAHSQLFHSIKLVFYYSLLNCTYAEVGICSLVHLYNSTCRKRKVHLNQHYIMIESHLSII